MPLKPCSIFSLFVVFYLIMQDEVRKIAQTLDLANQDRKDSQGICFLGKVFLSYLVHVLSLVCDALGKSICFFF